MIGTIEKWKVAAVVANLVLLAALFGAAAVFKLQRDNAELRLSTFKAELKAKVKEQETRVAVMQEQSYRALALQGQLFGNELEETQYEVARLLEKNATQGRSVDSLTRVNAGLLDAANSTRRALSGLLQTTRLSTEVGGNCDSRLAAEKGYSEVLVTACKQTTIEYNALREWADAECTIKGCE